MRISELLERSRAECIGYTLAGATTRIVPIHLAEQARTCEEEIVAILDSDRRLIIGILRNLMTHNPLLREWTSTHFIRNIDLLRRPEVRETLENFVSGKVHVIGCLEQDESGKLVFQDCKIPPMPGSYVYAIRSPYLLQKITGQGDYIHVGRHVYTGWDVPLLYTLVNHHVGIFGTTGTGKSRLAALLATKLAEKGWHVIIFDHTGVDYVPLLRDKAEIFESSQIEVYPDIFARSIVRMSRLTSYYAEYIELAFMAMVGTVKLEEILPSDKRRLLQQRKLTDGGEPEEEGEEEEETEETKPSVRSGKVLDVSRFEEFLQYVKVIMQSVGARMHSIAKVMAFLKTYVDPKIFEEYEQRTIKPRTIVETALKKGLTVVDLSADRELEIKQAIVASVIEAAWSMVKERKERLNIAFVIDEARNYVPAREEPPSKDPIVTTVREGRKWNLAVILVSQRYVGDIDPDVRSNLNTVFFGSLPSTADLNEMSRYMNLAGIDESSIVRLGQRQFYVTGLMNPLKVPILIQAYEI